MSCVPHTPDDRHSVECRASHESAESSYLLLETIRLGTFSKWRHSGVSWWTVGMVCTKLAIEMQSIKCFSARWLGNTCRAPPRGARSITVHSKYRPVRKCHQIIFMFRVKPIGLIGCAMVS